MYRYDLLYIWPSELRHHTKRVIIESKLHNKFCLFDDWFLSSAFIFLWMLIEWISDIVWFSFQLCIIVELNVSLRSIKLWQSGIETLILEFIKSFFSVYQITHFMWQMYITEKYNFVIIKKCRNSLRKAMRIIYARDMKAVCMFLYRYTIDPFYELHFVNNKPVLSLLVSVINFQLFFKQNDHKE